MKSLEGNRVIGETEKNSETFESQRINYTLMLCKMAHEKPAVYFYFIYLLI